MHSNTGDQDVNIFGWWLSSSHREYWEKDSGDIQEAEVTPLGDKWFLRDQHFILSQRFVPLLFPSFTYSPTLFGGKKSRWLTESLTKGKCRKRDESRSSSRKSLNLPLAIVLIFKTKEWFLYFTYSHDDFTLRTFQGNITTHLW